MQISRDEIKASVSIFICVSFSLHSQRQCCWYSKLIKTCMCDWIEFSKYTVTLIFLALVLDTAQVSQLPLMLLSFRILFDAEVANQNTSTSRTKLGIRNKRFALQKFDVIFLNIHHLSAIRRFMALPTYPGQKLIHFRHECVQIALCQLNESLWSPLG